ncbi:MAG: phosphopantetheine-binding protein, partial [Bacteroidota bacterium]
GRSARVSREADFFGLGGHSLLAMQVALRLQNVFRVDVPIRYLFEALTIEAIARRLVSEYPGIDRVAAAVIRVQNMSEEEKQDYRKRIQARKSINRTNSNVQLN